MVVVGLGRLPAFHDVEQLVLEQRLPPFETGQLVLEFGQLLGGHAAAGEELAVALLPLADRLDLPFELADVAVEVVEDDLDGDGGVPPRGAFRLEPFDLLLFGQGAAPVRQAGHLGVHSGEGQELGLHGGFDVHSAGSCFRRRDLGVIAAYRTARPVTRNPDLPGGGGPGIGA